MFRHILVWTNQFCFINFFCFDFFTFHTNNLMEYEYEEGRSSANKFIRRKQKNCFAKTPPSPFLSLTSCYTSINSYMENNLNIPDDSRNYNRRPPPFQKEKKRLEKHE